MKTELIEALKKTVDDLKFNRKKYSWSGGNNNCNMGILAQNITGERAFHMKHIWSLACRQTGESLDSVFSKLYSVGLTNEDIFNVEMLSDVNILREAGLEAEWFMDDIVGKTCNGNRMRKDHVIAYFEAWIRILEREGIPETQPITETKPELPNKEMEFVSYSEMKKEGNLLFQN